jgi:acetolactate synthase-1/2/3 large subunit
VATVPRPAPLPPPDPRRQDAAADGLAAASRPVLVVGLHARSGVDGLWLRALAEALPAPVLATVKARGALADPHPLALGPYPPSAVGARLLAQADMLVAIGVDVAELAAGPAPRVPLLMVGRVHDEAAERSSAMQVVGDLALVIEELAPRLRGRTRADWDVAALDRMKRGAAGVSPAVGLVRAARQVTAAGAVATADAALVAAVEAGWQSVAPHELLTALPPAPGGFAVAAAVAAALHAGGPALAFTDPSGLAAGVPALEVAAAGQLAVAVLVVRAGVEAAALEAAAPGVSAGGVRRATVTMGAVGGAAEVERRLAAALAPAVNGRAPVVIDCRLPPA